VARETGTGAQVPVRFSRSQTAQDQWLDEDYSKPPGVMAVELLVFRPARFQRVDDLAAKRAEHLLAVGSFSAWLAQALFLELLPRRWVSSFEAGASDRSVSDDKAHPKSRPVTFYKPRADFACRFLARVSRRCLSPGANSRHNSFPARLAIARPSEGGQPRNILRLFLQRRFDLPYSVLSVVDRFPE